MNLYSWLGVVGLIAGAVVAVKISKQGGLFIKRLWIMPTVMWTVTLVGYPYFGLGQVDPVMVSVACGIGLLMGWAQSRLSIREVDVEQKMVTTNGNMKMLVVGLVVVGALQYAMSKSGSFNPKQFAQLTLFMGLMSISTEKFSYFAAYLRARRALAANTA